MAPCFCKPARCSCLCNAAPVAPSALTEWNTFQAPSFEVVPPPGPGNFDVVVLGSGVSTAVPMMAHVLRRRCGPGAHVRRKCDGLTICEEAASNPGSKNRRFNVSLLVRYVPPEGGRAQHIMVDAGKTMRQAVLATFPKLGATSIDDLLITHGHADAMLGIDDLRDLQELEEVWENGEKIGFRLAGGADPLRVTSNADTLSRVRESFPYLSTSPDFVRPGVLMRRTAWLELQEVPDDNAEIDLGGLPVRLFPVWHGGTYVSLGFAFGRKEGGGCPFVYISDVKEVPPDTMAWLSDVAKAGIDLLIVDALSRSSHPSHFSLDDALDLIRRLRPAKALLVGMQGCGVGDHDEVNEELAALRASEDLDVQLAHDGLVLPELPSGVSGNPCMEFEDEGPQQARAP